MDPVEEGGAPPTEASKREHHRRKYFKRSTATALSEKIKRKLAKGKRAKMLGAPNHFALERLKTRRRFSSLSMPGAEEHRPDTEDESQAESGGDYTVISGVTHPSPVPSPTPHCSKERGEGARRKRENSYDIDNIVIPYSVAASTRLEKLQYKEILTPKWRVLPVEPMAKIDTKNNGVIRRPSQEEVEQAEDLTDEGLVTRHERCEQEERKKFSTYLKLPNSLRRSHRRAESSGGNTPDPMSPAAADGGGSPLTSPPATPQPAQPLDIDCIARRRTISLSTFDNVTEEVAPYEARLFPLSDETYEKMLRVMPPGHPFKAYSSAHTYTQDSESESRPLSPVSDSTESADTFLEEDPNDPEWTVDESTLERQPFKR